MRFPLIALAAVALWSCGGPTRESAVEEAQSAPEALALCRSTQALAEQGQLTSQEGSLTAAGNAETLVSLQTAGLPKSAADHTALALCLDSLFESIFHSFDRLGELAYLDTRLEIADTLGRLVLARQLAQQSAKEAWKETSLEQVARDPAQRDLWLAFHPRPRLEEITGLLKGQALDAELRNTLLQVAPYLRTVDVNLAAQLIASLQGEQRQFLLEVVARTMGRDAFLYSTRERVLVIQAYEERIAAMEKELKNCRAGDESCSRQRESLEVMKTTLRNLRTSPVGPRAEFAKLARYLTEEGVSDAQALVEQAADIARDANLEGATFGRLHLQEGDIWTQVSSGGMGDFFSRVSGFPSFASHSGAVVREEEDGFSLWFTMEISGSVHFALPQMDEPRIYWRPNFPMEKGFSTQALRNIERLAPVTFDVRMEEGITDSHGRSKLYCAELVHYLFKNRFDSHGPSHLSPFDGMRTTLAHLPEQALANIEAIGISTRQNFFSPENFHYSPHLDLLGFTFPDSSLWGDDGSQQQLHAQALAKRMNNWMAESFQTRPLAPVPFVTRRAVDAMVIGSWLGQIFPLQPLRKAQALLEAFPEGREKYQMGRLFLLLSRAQKSLEIPRTPDGQVPADWRERMNSAFEKDALPTLQKLFR